MSKTRWQFSLRAILILTAILSVIVAFTSNYPGIALIILCGTIYVLFESGAIVSIILGFSQPATYAKHPIFATFTWLITGLFCLALSGMFWWSALSPKSQAPFWAPLIPALGSAAFGGYCLYLLYRSIRHPPSADDKESGAHQPDTRR
jgi:hypothetical protein